jgi:hypothetical protein
MFLSPGNNTDSEKSHIIDGNSNFFAQVISDDKFDQSRAGKNTGDLDDSFNSNTPTTVYKINNNIYVKIEEQDLQNIEFRNSVNAEGRYLQATIKKEIILPKKSLIQILGSNTLLSQKQKRKVKPVAKRISFAKQKRPNIIGKQVTRFMPKLQPSHKQKNVRKLEISSSKQSKTNNIGTLTCRCKNSKCSKSYCVCHSNGKSCGANCECINCENQHVPPQKKIKKKAHRSCTCVNTRCIKKYCKCFKAGIDCGKNCKCIDCSNKK